MVLALLFVLLITTPSAHADAIGNAWSSTAEFFYTLNHGPCGSARLSDLTGAICACEGATGGKCSNPSLTQRNLSQLSSVEENLFFNFAAQEEVDTLECRDKHLLPVSHSPTLQPIERQAIQNIASHLLELRKLKKIITDANQTINAYDDEIGRGAVGPDDAADKIREEKALRAHIELAAKQIALITQSLWLSSDPAMQKYIQKVIDSNIDPKTFVEKASEIHHVQVFSGALSGLTGNIPDLIDPYSFRSQATEQMELEVETADKKFKKGSTTSRGYTTYNLDGSLKDFIVQNSDAIGELESERKANPAALRGLACRLDSRYGSGKESLNNWRDGITFVATLPVAEVADFAGGAIAATAAKLGSAVRLGADAIAGQLGVSEYATGVLLTAGRLGVGAAGFGAMAAQIAKSCGITHLPGVSMKPQKSCGGSNSDWQKAEVKSLQDGNCALALAMPVVIGVAGKYILGIGKTHGHPAAEAGSTSGPQAEHLVSETHSTGVDNLGTNTGASHSSRIQTLQAQLNPIFSRKPTMTDEDVKTTIRELADAEGTKSPEELEKLAQQIAQSKKIPIKKAREMVDDVHGQLKDMENYYGKDLLVLRAEDPKDYGDLVALIGEKEKEGTFTRAEIKERLEKAEVSCGVGRPR